MKKRFYRILLINSLSIWILCVGFIIIPVTFQERNLDSSGITIALILSSVFVLIRQSLVAYNYIPRMKYLENNDHTKPTFKAVWSSEMDMSPRFDFFRLKGEIASKWLITFSDDANQILKFGTKMSFFFERETAAWLKFDRAAGKIHLECFPMSGFRNKEHARWLQIEVEEILWDEYLF